MPVEAVNATPVAAVKSQPVKKEITKTQNIESDENDNSNKLLLALGALAVIGIGAIAYCKYHKKPNAPTSTPSSSASSSSSSSAPDPVEKAKEFVKNFFGANGKAVKGVKFENGIAKTADGNMFTGTMKGTDKAGRNFEFTYNEGKITESKINDKLFKKYNYHINGDCTEIKTFAENDELKRETLLRSTETSYVKHEWCSKEYNADGTILANKGYSINDPLCMDSHIHELKAITQGLETKFYDPQTGKTIGIITRDKSNQGNAIKELPNGFKIYGSINKGETLTDLMDKFYDFDKVYKIEKCALNKRIVKSVESAKDRFIVTENGKTFKMLFNEQGRLQEISLTDLATNTTKKIGLTDRGRIDANGNTACTEEDLNTILKFLETKENRSFKHKKMDKPDHLDLFSNELSDFIDAWLNVKV